MDFKTRLLLLVMLTSFALAHAPSSIDTKYNQDTQTLEVEISHQVSNPDRHYINEIAIHVNGVEEKVQKYETQPNQNPFTYEINLQANPGDEIKTTAYCSLLGSLTDTVQVSLSAPKPNLNQDSSQTSTTQDTTTLTENQANNFTWIIPLVVLAALAGLAYKKLS